MLFPDFPWFHVPSYKKWEQANIKNWRSPVSDFHSWWATIACQIPKTIRHHGWRTKKILASGASTIALCVTFRQDNLTCLLNTICQKSYLEYTKSLTSKTNFPPWLGKIRDFWPLDWQILHFPCNRLTEFESTVIDLFHVCFFRESSKVMIYPPWLGKILDFRLNDRLNFRTVD